MYQEVRLSIKAYKLPLFNPKFVMFRSLTNQVQGIKIDETSASSTEEFNNALPYEKIPGPSGLSFILSNLPGGEYKNLPMNDLLSAFRQKYGNILRIPKLFGNSDIIMSFDPEDYKTLFRNEGIWPNRRSAQTFLYYRHKLRTDIYDKAPGLLTTQGKEWGEFRTATNPVMMQPKTVKYYIPVIDNVVEDFLNKMREIRNTETLEMPLNFEEEINKWALESIGAIALDTRLGLVDGTSKDSRANTLIDSIKEILTLSFDLEFKPSLWRYYATPSFKKFIQAMENVTNTTDSYIKEAREHLDKLSKNESLDHEEGVLRKLLKINPNVAHVMAMDMMFAGIDTTSSVLVSTIYLLAKNPDKQEILRKEIKNVLKTKDTPFTTENMNNLPYLRACIKEAMRLYPPSSVNIRNVDKDVVLNGYQVPKGTDVIMNMFALQRSDENFPQALKFIPERWLKDADRSKYPSAKTAHPFIYLPFGFGPRMCIGKRFALMEIEILTARMIRNFELEWNHPDLKYKTSLINAPDGDLMFKVKDIKD